MEWANTVKVISKILQRMRMRNKDGVKFTCFSVTYYSYVNSIDIPILSKVCKAWICDTKIFSASYWKSVSSLGLLAIIAESECKKCLKSLIENLIKTFGYWTCLLPNTSFTSYYKLDVSNTRIVFPVNNRPKYTVIIY